MKLKIKITQEVLEATKMCDYHSVTHNCAIAYACKQLFQDCIVGFGYIAGQKVYGIYTPLYKQIAELPQTAIDFIKKFDKTAPQERVKMKPFEFEITLTDEALDLIAIDEVTKILEESTTLEVI